MSADDDATQTSDQEPVQAPEREPSRPVLRIVRGDATPEEVAALVSVLSARADAAVEEPPRPRRSEWAGHERRMRPPLHPAPGAWRASFQPR